MATLEYMRIMDSNTTSYKQIDDRGRNDLERIIEELTNENLILKEQKDILDLRVKYLQQQIRNYGKKD
jgi:hypothetical protein